MSCQLSGQQYREAVTQKQPRVAALRGYPGKPFGCEPSTPTGASRGPNPKWQRTDQRQHKQSFEPVVDLLQPLNETSSVPGIVTTSLGLRSLPDPDPSV